MFESSEYAYFVNFPRRDLSFKFSRRGLLQTAALEYEVMTGKARGGTEYKLSQLGSLANEHLAQLQPRIISGSRITSHDGAVWGQPPESAQPKRLFFMELATLYAFNLMNGRNTLQAITLSLAEHMAWTPEQAFAFVRGLFLHLVQLRICLPQG